jgi:hypothetical protein
VLTSAVACALLHVATAALGQEGDGQAGAAGIDVAPAIASLFDASRDEILSKVYVPSPNKRVGEVRLIRRGDVDVVQTLLATKVLVRVVGEIRKKEIANWPSDQPGYADAVRYLAALEEVRDRLWREIPLNDRRADRRQKMIIEFALDAGRASVMVGGFEMDDRRETALVTSRRPLVVLQPERAYVERNMRLIVEDSFHAEGPALDALLRPFANVHAPSEPQGAPPE